MLKLRQINSLQDLEELKFFATTIRDLKISKYLEIGSWVGDTLYAAIANSPLGCYGLSIDVNSGANETVSELNALGYSVEAYLGDSRDPNTIAYAKSKGPYDVVFIDGNHTYDYAKSDWENYGPMGKVVIFHDTHMTDGQGAVHHLWSEIKSQGYRTTEFETPGSTMGYGVIYA